MYFRTHINIKKIPKYCKKLRICKTILHCFSLFEVLYNWVKFRRLKMGDPVHRKGDITPKSYIVNCPSSNTLKLLARDSNSTRIFSLYYRRNTIIFTPKFTLKMFGDFAGLLVVRFKFRAQGF